MNGKTHSGNFYSDTAEKGNEVLAEPREVAENIDNAEGVMVMPQLRKTRAQVSI